MLLRLFCCFQKIVSCVRQYSPPPSERGSKKTNILGRTTEKTNKQSEEEGFKYRARLVLLRVGVGVGVLVRKMSSRRRGEDGADVIISRVQTSHRRMGDYEKLAPKQYPPKTLRETLKGEILEEL